MQKKLSMIVIAVVILALIIYFNLIFMAVALAVVLGILVFVHELGHFLFAKLMGVGVDTFSLGFGPRIFGFRHGKTDYRISAVPLGGYVKMVGEDPTADIPERDKARSFTHKPVWRRFLIVFAGPLFNILLAFVVLFGIIKFTGITDLLPKIGDFPEDSPAQAAGIQKDDLITDINGIPIKTWDEMADAIRNCKGNDLTIVVDRNGQSLTFTVTPTTIEGKTVFGEDVTHYAIGIINGPYFEHKPLGIGATFVKAAQETVGLCKLMVQIIVKLFEGVVPLDTLGGPILVAQMAETQAKTGVLEFLFFLALFSVNLGVLNLIPIPVMDGGHLLMYIIEGIKGKPVGENYQEVLNRIGIGLLIALMVLVFYNDIKRVFFPPAEAKLMRALKDNPMPEVAANFPAIKLANIDDLRNIQIGYNRGDAGLALADRVEERPWSVTWVVIGESLDQEPLFVSLNEAGSAFPVYAGHKLDDDIWQPRKAANSIPDFVSILNRLNAEVQKDTFDAEAFLADITAHTDDLSLWREYAQRFETIQLSVYNQYFNYIAQHNLLFKERNQHG